MRKLSGDVEVSKNIVLYFEAGGILNNSMCCLQSQYSQVRDLNRQFQMQITSRIDQIESQKNQFQNLQARKITSIEDLFETQRRELFSKLTELEKSLTNKYGVLERALLEIA